MHFLGRIYNADLGIRERNYYTKQYNRIKMFLRYNNMKLRLPLTLAGIAAILTLVPMLMPNSSGLAPYITAFIAPIPYTIYTLLYFILKEFDFIWNNFSFILANAVVFFLLGTAIEKANGKTGKIVFLFLLISIVPLLFSLYHTFLRNSPFF